MNRFNFQEEFVKLMDKAIETLPPSELDKLIERIETELEDYKNL